MALNLKLNHLNMGRPSYAYSADTIAVYLEGMNTSAENLLMVCDNIATFIDTRDALMNKHMSVEAFQRVTGVSASLEGIGDALKKAWDWLVDKLKRFWAWLKGLWNKIFGSSKSPAKKAADTIKDHTPIDPDTAARTSAALSDAVSEPLTISGGSPAPAASGSPAPAASGSPAPAASSSDRVKSLIAKQKSYINESLKKINAAYVRTAKSIRSCRFTDDIVEEIPYMEVDGTAITKFVNAAYQCVNSRGNINADKLMSDLEHAGIEKIVQMKIRKFTSRDWHELEEFNPMAFGGLTPALQSQIERGIDELERALTSMGQKLANGQRDEAFKKQYEAARTAVETVVGLNSDIMNAEAKVMQRFNTIQNAIARCRQARADREHQEGLDRWAETGETASEALFRI